MVRFFHAYFTFASRRVTATILAFTLCCGYLLGSIFALLPSTVSYVMMHDAMLCPVSAMSLIGVILLPFLFTVFAVYIRQIWLIIPVSFLKAFSFEFLSSSILCTMGTAGRLVRILFLFSDLLSLPVLCWFWLYALNHSSRLIYRNFVIIIMLLIGIISLDYQIVSPLLVNLLS